MIVQDNPYRGRGIEGLWSGEATWPSTDAGAVAGLLARCPAFGATPLLAAAGLAERAGVAEVSLKDERSRMGLGSFKALGAAYVIARDACAAAGPEAGDASLSGALSGPLSGKVYVAASAGNHGLSVAAGARVFGATAVVYLSRSVPEAFAGRLRAYGARVERAGATYEASMAAAAEAAERHGWVLLSDASWPGYVAIPRRVMEGYLQMIAETVDAMPAPPTHVFLQAGVGGMAASIAALARERWGDAPLTVVVEPKAAPALVESIRAGRAVVASGPVSCMGRLDCKEPSLLALAGLARDADAFATIDEEEVLAGVAALRAAGLATTPSGGAGVAALLTAAAGPEREALRLRPDSRVLAFLSEGVEAP